jgi:predicted HicB family RNase H-like nuclease
MNETNKKTLTRTRAINVQVPGVVHERLRRAAQAERRSLRQQIAVFLEEAAERFEAENKE